jgi:hypothetical protein
VLSPHLVLMVGRVPLSPVSGLLSCLVNLTGRGVAVCEVLQKWGDCSNNYKSITNEVFKKRIIPIGNEIFVSKDYSKGKIDHEIQDSRT